MPNWKHSFVCFFSLFVWAIPSLGWAQAQRVDLQIRALQLSTSSIPVNGKLTISFEVFNSGNNPAGASQTLVAISDNTTISEQDRVKARVTTPALAAKQAHKVNLTIIVGGVTARAYYLGVVADIKKAVAESNEKNNVTTAALTVTQTQLPDLVVNAMSVSNTTVSAGQSVTISVTVKNNGQGAAPATVGAFFLSTNNTITTGDTKFHTLNIPALGPGKSWSTKVTGPVLSILAPGRYWVGTLVNLSLEGKSPPDRQGRITESNFKNNTRAVEVRVTAADLVVSNLQVKPSNFKAGSAITATLAVKNQGQVDATATTLNLYFSTDSAITTSDRFVKTVNVPALKAGATQPLTISVTVTTTMMQGFASSFFAGAFVDPKNTVTETNNGNNTTSIRVNAPNVDLVPTGFTLDKAAYAPNSTATLSITVTNKGTSPSVQTNVDIVYATNSALSSNRRRLGTVTLPALKAGESKTLPARVIIPSTASMNTTRYLGVEVDTSRKVAESNESNNQLVKSFRVAGTDVAASALTLAPTTSNPGGSVVASWSVKNVGGTAVKAYQASLYISRTTSTTGSTRLATVNIPAQNPGATTSNKTTLKLPASLTTGRYYILLVADSGRAIRETNENNNHRSAVLNIVTGIELQPTAFNLSATNVRRGQKITFTLVVANRGTRAAGKFSNAIRYSYNNNFTTQDPRIANPVANSVAAGKSIKLTGSLTIPTGARIGVGYLFVNVDEPNAVKESNEGNNRAFVKINVLPPPRPDLVVDSIKVSRTLIPPGGAITSTITIRNAGAGNAPASETRVYLSPKPTLASGSVRLLTIGTGALGAGKSAPASRVISIPQSVRQGQYYLVVIADYPKKVTESNENNNSKSIPVTISTGDPDNDKDGFPASKDCNDNDKTVNPNAKEVCDKVDNNCDGKINEGTTCPAGQYCSKTLFKCVPNPTEPSPEPVPDGGPADVSPPDVCGTCKPGETCVNNRCREDNCYDLRRCNNNQICLKGRCVTNPCNGIVCKKDEFCRLGVCVKSCADVTCQNGEKCVDGTCLPDQCASVSCAPDTICDPNSGRCIKDPCNTVTCGKGRVCVNGKCEDSPCATVRCPAQQVCKEGQCVKESTPPEPVQEPSRENSGEEPDTNDTSDASDGTPDEPKQDQAVNTDTKTDTDVVDTTKGNDGKVPELKDVPLPSDGCLCQSSSPWSGSPGFLLILCVLFLQRRRRK